MGDQKSARHLFLGLWIALALFNPFPAGAQETPPGGEYFARCNLKVIEGSRITWLNWQSSPTFIPAGTRLKVTTAGDKATLVDVKTGATYTLDIGASGEHFLEKFVSRKTPPISGFPASIQANIQQAVARVGMTKEQVYIAMGPPANLGQIRTNTSTYKDIMAANLWVYARRRFGKNIGIEFNPSTGLVVRTEGLWGK